MTSVGNVGNFDVDIALYNYGNFFVGPSGNSKNTGYFNAALGVGALTNNWDIYASGSVATHSTALGGLALANSSAGDGNIALGFQAGINFTGDESQNIDIGNVGVAGENYTIRIGDPTVQTTAHIAGIYGATPNQAHRHAATFMWTPMASSAPSAQAAAAVMAARPTVVTNNDTQPITLSTLSVSRRPVRVNVDPARYRL